MQISHIALWTLDLEQMIHFYQTHFGARSGPRYHNPAKGFSSCFISLGQGPRLELMSRTELSPLSPAPAMGYAHFALSVGSESEVDRYTKQLAAAGVPVLDGPRHTGDGYYESVVMDPDGNRIEITV